MLRELARRVAPLYWLVGFARHARHHARLRAHDRAYAVDRPQGLPPPALRYRVQGAFDDQAYLRTGELLADCVVDAWRRHGGSATPRVLDFGCGPGRVAAGVKRRLPGCKLHASDIDAQSIAWAQANLQGIGSFEANAALPPLRMPAASFDLAYAISVFTHLDEATQLAWIAELARVLRPGGLLLATVHGRAAQSSCTSRERAQLAQRGFAYRVDRRGRFKLDGLPDSYQTTFHTREYVERAWQGSLRIVEYREGGVAGHQDVVVLRLSAGA